MIGDLRDLEPIPENGNDFIADVRQRFLLMCQKQYGLWAEEIKEETPFYEVVNDSLDFVELILRCEKEFKISIDETGKDEYSFDTVKDFIDWIINFFL